MAAQDELKGVGPKSRDMLKAAGITTLVQLHELGSVTAYVKVKQAGCKPSLNFLWGLESMLSGERWRQVAKKHRLSLLSALENAEKNHGMAGQD
jgi:DNA transformation protein